MIVRKGAEEIDRMRQAGRIVAEALATMCAHIAPGVRTIELDDIARAVIEKHGARPSFLGYPAGDSSVAPFPACVCVSINEEVVHGIPGPRTLSDGDLVSLDCGCSWRGFHGDAAVTVGVGHVDEKARRLMDATSGALAAGIAAMRPGSALWDVIRAVQSYVEDRSFGVIREYQGHGIGREMHEPPSIPNFLGQPRVRNVPLEPGLALALEPMVTEGGWETRVLADGWTVVTLDGSRAAHFEHTVVVTDSGAEVLTSI